MLICEICKNPVPSEYIATYDQSEKVSVMRYYCKSCFPHSNKRQLPAVPAAGSFVSCLTPKPAAQPVGLASREVQTVLGRT